MNNKIKVNIAGSVYTIIGEKSKDEVEAIANFVDEEIKKITSQNYLLNSTMAATLVALNVSSDNFDLRKEINLLSEDSEFPIKKQEEFLKNNQKIENQRPSARKLQPQHRYGWKDASPGTLRHPSYPQDGYQLSGSCQRKRPVCHRRSFPAAGGSRCRPDRRHRYRHSSAGCRPGSSSGGCR